MVFRPVLLHAAPQQSAAAPEVTKIEPPNWWIGLTPQVLLLLTGHGLEATHVGCNLPSVRVTRTQATAGGDYLFVWLKIGPETRSGTAVCRIRTTAGPAAFELPLAARSGITGKFQGLSSGEGPYFITLKPPGDANPSDDKTGAVHSPRDQLAAGAHVAGDLREIRGHLAELKNHGATALRLSPLAMPDSDNRSRDAFDFYSMDPVLGSLRDFQELVASAHTQNMKVILDLDLLYIGEHHPWESKPPLAEWLGVAANPRGNFSKPSGESFKQVLDTENPLVALYLLQNSIWWVETGGLDGIHVTSARNATSQFWRSWRTGLQKIYPHLAIINE
ncbi:MAG: cyclomaltodextrinase N-terminal domain-containing protein [Candidatus Acidiferrales bacterium]